MGFCSALHSKMMLFLSDEKYCDVKIRVQDGSFMCHRVVLASASEYFDALFGGSFMEKDARETVLHDIDVITFTEILKFSYTAKMCEITASNVFDLLRASSFLRIHSLEEACSKFILKNVSSILNHVWILVFARSFNMTALIDGITDHIIQNFRSFYNDETLLEVMFDDLVFLLDRWSKNRLPFKYEDLLLHFLIRWVHHASEERREYFMKLITAVDFERISPDYVSFMTHYLKDFIDQLGLEQMPQLNLPLVLKENKSTVDVSVHNQHDNTEDSKKRLCLKRKLSNFFTGNKKLSATCGEDIPTSFYNPTFYKDVLGLHVHVEYFSINCLKKKYNKYFEGVKVLTSNRYNPDWIVSCETDAWRSCTERCTIVQESTHLLYSMEIFEDEHDSVDNRQTFCTYSTVDLKLASSVLASPPVPLQSKTFSMCATPTNNIYLFTFNMEYGNYELFANDLFSVEELNRGFYCYNCDVDKWFPAPKMKSYHARPKVCADHNLIYSVSERTVQAFDYRIGKWMQLPACNDLYSGYYSSSCILQNKLFISSEPDHIPYYDTVAGKWGTPLQSNINGRVLKMLPYDNKLHFLYISSMDYREHHSIATYCPNTQEWYYSEKLDIAADTSKPNRTDGHYIYEWNIKDMIAFKTFSS